MAFGPMMEFAVEDLKIRLAAIKKEELSAFVSDGAMQSLTVKRYMGNQFSQVIEDEHDWFEKSRKDFTGCQWGIYVEIDKVWHLIGTTGLHAINSEHFKTAVSGIMIFRPEYWGRGIASAAHKARTWYAFTQLGIHQIRSAVYAPNTGSFKALASVGYVELFRERNELFVDGSFVDKLSLNVINPLPIFWDAWWHGDAVPSAYVAAREKSQAALDWAAQHVTFP